MLPLPHDVRGLILLFIILSSDFLCKFKYSRHMSYIGISYFKHLFIACRFDNYYNNNNLSIIHKKKTLNTIIFTQNSFILKP